MYGCLYVSLPSLGKQCMCVYIPITERFGKRERKRSTKLRKNKFWEKCVQQNVVLLHTRSEMIETYTKDYKRRAPFRFCLVIPSTRFGRLDTIVEDICPLCHAV